MSNSLSYFLVQLNELEQLIDEDEELSIALRIYNRLTSRIRRRLDLLQQEELIAKLCSIREKLFSRRFLAPFSLFYGTLLLLFLAMVGIALIFTSLKLGLFCLLIGNQTMFTIFLDHYLLPIVGQYIFLAGIFLPTQLLIGNLFGLYFQGYYLGPNGQPCLKKDCKRYLLMPQRQKIIYYLILNLVPPSWLAFSGFIIQYLNHTLLGYITVLFHILLISYIGIVKNRGDVYRLIREIKIAKEQKLLNKIYKK